MSEENLENVQVEEKQCKCKIWAILVIISLILSIASLTTSIIALNGGGGANGGKKVVISKQYDKGKSLDKAKATGKPIIVFFYTDWCGFCQRFAPTFAKITKSKEMKQNFATAFVNCEKPENQSIMQEYGVQGFPTVYVINTDGSKTQLENNTFFNADSVDVVKAKALEIIGIK